MSNGMDFFITCPKCDATVADWDERENRWCDFQTRPLPEEVPCPMCCATIVLPKEEDVVEFGELCGASGAYDAASRSKA